MAFLSAPTLTLGTTRTHRHGARMCAASGRSRTSSGVTADEREALWRSIGEMRKCMERAVSAERYGDAARLRDEIESLSLTDDWYRVQRQLDAAVADERFGDAARWRDELAALEPPPGERREPWSECTTRDIHVRVDAFYMPGQSQPTDGQLLFGYRVRITNNSPNICQLVSRHWKISAPNVADKHVRGKGVVGKQPVLEPGATFEYTSACPVSAADAAPDSVVGSMSGFYYFQSDFGEFEVRVQPFYFLMPTL